MICVGELERGSNNPWQQANRSLRLLGAVDADVIAARDLVENLAGQLGYALPKRKLASEMAKGANSQAAPESEPKPGHDHL